MLGRCQAEIGHQFARVIKPLEVANLGHHRDCHTSHRLHGFNYRPQIPAWSKLLDLFSSPVRCSLASISASRRSVFTRSPVFTGMSDGATTMQSWPCATSCR